MSHMLYGTVWCFIAAHVSLISIVNDSNSNSSIGSSDNGSSDTSSSDNGSSDTSSSAKGSNSQQRMLASQCSNGGSRQPHLGLR